MAVVAFSLTHVRYEQGDLWGELLSLISLSPIFIVVMLATLVVFRRDFHSLFFLSGQILNEVLNFVLKKTFNHTRPQGSDREDSGMPSNHAQFMMFFATYTLIFIAKNARASSRHERAIAGIGSHTLASAVCYSRIYLKYHTADQVIAGSIVGIIAGISWYQVVEKIFRPFFPYFETFRISKFLLLRDYTHVPDVIKFEYQCSQQLRRSLYSGRANNNTKKSM